MQWWLALTCLASCSMGCSETLLALEIKPDAAAQAPDAEQQREKLRELKELAAENENGAESSAA